MRLVCPNCEAKYEVPDDAIPDTGRDVQCANCSHAWFQVRSRTTSATPPVASAVSTPASPVGTIDTPSAPPARAQDENVLTILREEAEREAKARREKTRLLGTQPEAETEAAAETGRKAASRRKDADPGPEVQPAPAPPQPTAPSATQAPAATASPPARAVSSPSRAPKPDPFPEPEVELKVAARRDLLPDVEEIKSTLQPSESEDPDSTSSYQGEGDGRDRSGAFRSGFLLVITLAILSASIYSSAHWLAAKVPALSGPLASYVGAVDALRLELDGLMRAATRLISGDKA